MFLEAIWLYRKQKSGVKISIKESKEMNKPTDREFLKKEVEAIHKNLIVAMQEAECVLSEIESGQSMARFRKSFMMDMLHYIVRLDSSMAEIHQHRQRIMDAQVQAAAAAN